jgi:hypothetical protein
MMMQQDPFAQYGMQQPFPMAGPSGLAGDFSPGAMGGGMFGAPPKKKQGMNPLMMMSPLMAMFASGHPNLGLGMISPGLGLARALGVFK